MTFPFLILALGLFGVLAYFARRNVTYTAQRGTQGSVGMAFVVFVVFAIIAWILDSYLAWSVVPQFMYSQGGALGSLSIAFFASFGLLCLSMLNSARQCGQMVA